MEQVKNAANKAAFGMAAVGGYGSIGLLVEAVVHHFATWLPPGLVTMATTTALHGMQRAWQGWLETTRGLRETQEATDVESSDTPSKKEN